MWLYFFILITAVSHANTDGFLHSQPRPQHRQSERERGGGREREGGRERGRKREREREGGRERDREREMGEGGEERN